MARPSIALESRSGAFSIGYYSDLFEEAAALLESLATNHPFLDGNKRTAFYAADSFLRVNGYFIDCDADEANRFIRNILVDRQDRFDRVRNWLKTHVEPTPS
ncbi:MAG: type II toxin-antitoxin system death-on-curing family toxin [Caldilineaceae bacterium]|nr:type II toxin-antitoxin system death-on-curing family toxin [Caldilineaceae bacterium]